MADDIQRQNYKPDRMPCLNKKHYVNESLFHNLKLFKWIIHGGEYQNIIVSVKAAWVILGFSVLLKNILTYIREGLNHDLTYSTF